MSSASGARDDDGSSARFDRAPGCRHLHQHNRPFHLRSQSSKLLVIGVVSEGEEQVQPFVLMLMIETAGTVSVVYPDDKT